MQTETRKLAELKPDPQNARTHDERNLEAITESLTRFGQRKPIVITPEGVILAGNGTYTAATKLGWNTIEVAVTPADWDYATARAYALADNRSAELAAWEPRILADQLVELDAEGWDITALGFDLPTTEQPEPEDEGPLTFDEEAEPVTKVGDIYQLGEHRLMCGDSTSIDAVDKLMHGNKADLIFTDPPYGVNYEGINNDDQAGLEGLLREVFGNYILSCKPGASIYVFHSDRNADIFHKVFREYFHFSSMIIWFKNSLTLSQTDYQSQHEPCLYGWANNGTHNWYGDRKQISVWQFDKERVEGHTTPKPTALVANALKNSSKPKHLVIDFFAGSGSTLIAAEQTKRICYGMELDPKYCDVIVKRWEQYTGKKAELINE